MNNLRSISDEDQLESMLSRPYEEDVEAARELGGDVIVLGAGGKMGPTLVRRIAESLQVAGQNHQLYAVSRFSDKKIAAKLEAAGATTLSKDLLREKDIESLPRCSNVIYMVGMKFGASGNQPLTWVMNSYLPGRVLTHFKGSRVVAFSTGNVYPFVPPSSGGCREEDVVGPVGEYAQSCLGRERVLEYFSESFSNPCCILRLNYAVEARYGVLVDIGQKILQGIPVPLGIGHVNLIWQGDANSFCLRSLELCTVPARILNITGAEILSVRWLAEELGRRLRTEPRFCGTEGETALLNNAARSFKYFGKPKVKIDGILDLVANWLKSGSPVLGKPTKFEVSNGQF